MIFFKWARHVDFEYFSVCLNNLHLAVKYTFEKAKLIQNEHCQPYQVLNFWDIEVISHSDNTVQTDLYYKGTNSHDYFPYTSAHTNNFKDNLHIILLSVLFLSLMMKSLR